MNQQAAQAAAQPAAQAAAAQQAAQAPAQAPPAAQNAQNPLTEGLRELRLEVRAQGVVKQIREYDGEGSRKFREWLRDIDRAGSVVGATDERYKTFALQTLKGTAGDFVARLFRLHPQLTWEQLRQQLVNQYSDTGDQHMAQIKLKGLKQKGGETIQNFSERIYALADEAFVGENMGNPLIQRQLVEILLGGVISYGVAKRLVNERPQTLDEALRIAVREQQNVHALELRRRQEEPMDVSVASADEQNKTDRVEMLAQAVQGIEERLNDVLAVDRNKQPQRWTQLFDRNKQPQRYAPPNLNTAWRSRPMQQNRPQQRQTPATQAALPRNSQGRPSRGDMSKWFTSDNRPICFTCEGIGHLSRQCRSRRFNNAGGPGNQTNSKPRE